VLNKCQWENVLIVPLQVAIKAGPFGSDIYFFSSLFGDLQPQEKSGGMFCPAGGYSVSPAADFLDEWRICLFCSGKSGHGVSDNDFLDFGELIFAELSETDTTGSDPEFREEFAGLRFGSQKLDGEALSPKVVRSAINVYFGGNVVNTLVLVKAHAGETTHADISNRADNIRMMNNAAVLQFESLVFSPFIHSSILPFMRSRGFSRKLQVK